jgi:hypothetical protein
LAAVLLLGGKRPALAAYLSGKSDDMAAAQLDLAKEWASIPGPDGRGVYDGDSAGNRAHIQMEATQAALKAARAGLAGGTMATIKPAPPARPNAAAKITPASPFSTSLTPHITLGEFALGQEARRFQHQHQVDTALALAKFLEQVRSAFGGKPVIITSGYRPPAVNRAVGGATNSEHLFSVPQEGAVDFLINGVDTFKVQSWCDSRWPHSLGYGAAKGFVHLGRRADGKRRRWDY